MLSHIFPELLEGGMQCMAFVSGAPLEPYTQGRWTCVSPRCSASNGGGRGPEFSVSGPPPQGGIQWNRWRSNPGEKAPMPLLPFQPHEVLLPGEEKTLHLFEARYLALFDDVVGSYEQRFGHILLSQERASLAASGTLVRISEWERMDVGVKVRLHGVGRILVSAVEQGTSSPYILGSVAFVADSDLDDPEADASLESLLNQEEQFWKLAMRVIDMCVDLSVPPFRSKKHFAPPTLPGDSFGATSFVPPPEAAHDSVKKAHYLDQLRTAVERASWPVSSEADATSMADEERTRFRLLAVSFAGYELFPSDAGMRQRALEMTSTAKRFRIALSCIEERLKLLEAQMAIRKAFPST